ncbi:tyrosine-protein kinase BAZ1B-like [Octopus sinensis]|uniref:Tyrosine-protein kinase BAZ1B-like n=1 Tax=Octopus sinensis TaxID=2607531 RepID=A0A7E6EM10_9MOLL|nr:tyrosine-protein kinase BAZ1B-like [Octopus sinensis]
MSKETTHINKYRPLLNTWGRQNGISTANSTGTFAYAITANAATSYNTSSTIDTDIITTAAAQIGSAAAAAVITTAANSQSCYSDTTTQQQSGTSDKVVKAKVVRIDTCGIQANPKSNCSSPSSNKENTDENSPNKDTGQKKWLPPKLVLYKYSIQLNEEEKIINCVPPADLTRVDRPPPKELRLFIRTHALCAGVTYSSPWVVDDVMIIKTWHTE